MNSCFFKSFLPLALAFSCACALINDAANAASPSSQEIKEGGSPAADLWSEFLSCVTSQGLSADDWKMIHDTHSAVGAYMVRQHLLADRILSNCQDILGKETPAYSSHSLSDPLEEESVKSLIIYRVFKKEIGAFPLWFVAVERHDLTLSALKSQYWAPDDCSLPAGGNEEGHCLLKRIKVVSKKRSVSKCLKFDFRPALQGQRADFYVNDHPFYIAPGKEFGGGNFLKRFLSGCPKHTDFI